MSTEACAQAVTYFTSASLPGSRMSGLWSRVASFFPDDVWKFRASSQNLQEGLEKHGSGVALAGYGVAMHGESLKDGLNESADKISRAVEKGAAYLAQGAVMVTLLAVASR
eukprot:5853191-Amphidinium_carterae.1